MNSDADSHCSALALPLTCRQQGPRLLITLKLWKASQNAAAPYTRQEVPFAVGLNAPPDLTGVINKEACGSCIARLALSVLQFYFSRTLKARVF